MLIILVAGLQVRVSAQSKTISALIEYNETYSKLLDDRQNRYIEIQKLDMNITHLIVDRIINIEKEL